MTATCTNFCTSIGLEPNYGARGEWEEDRCFRFDAPVAIPHRRGRERERGMGRLGAAKRGSGARRRLQAFLQAFPNLGCFSPSFSKESFGRFVGFQWVARLPNPMSPLPNILLSLGSKNPSQVARPMGIVEGTLKHATMDAVFPKENRHKNRRFLFQRARRPPKRRPAFIIESTFKRHFHENSTSRYFSRSQACAWGRDYGDTIRSSIRSSRNKPSP